MLIHRYKAEGPDGLEDRPGAGRKPHLTEEERSKIIADGWDENGVFLYTGEGQVGDMAFVRGSQAIRDHSANGKDLHLFRSLGKGQSYRYLGRFACSSWEYRKGVDVNGDERRTIVFHLVQPEGDKEAAAAPEPGSATLGQLQQRALNAAAKPGEKSPKETRSRYHQRSAAVRVYVLPRADGTCESCGGPTPFARKVGTPYLEPYHTRRLAPREGPSPPIAPDRQ